MAITKTKILKKFEVDGENESISIAYDIVVTDDVEGELARKTFRRAFVQADGVQAIKDWTGISSNQNIYIQFINALWA